MLGGMPFRMPSLALGALLSSWSHAIAQTLPQAFDAGPLLCFTTDAPSGESCEVRLHVVPIHADAAPIVAYARSATPRQAELGRWLPKGGCVRALARLDRDHLLVGTSGPSELLAVDLVRRTHRVVAAVAPDRFVGVHGGDVLHRGGLPAEDGLLFASPWTGAGERRRLAAERFASVPVVAGNVAVGIHAGETAVAVVGIATGRSRVVWTPPAGAHTLRVALAPGGQRVAIGAVQANGLGLLAVADVATATVVRSWPDLPIRLSAFSSFLPCVEVGWHDDDEVVCSESRGDPQGIAGNFVFVRRSVATGATTDENAYAPLGLQHAAPPPPDAPSRPEPRLTLATVRGETHLCCAGAGEPLARFPSEGHQWNDVSIAPDGRSAVARLGDDRSRCTLFADGKAPGRVLVAAPAHDFVWLPAVSPHTRAGR
jgi:hypothetical protein